MNKRPIFIAASAAFLIAAALFYVCGKSCVTAKTGTARSDEKAAQKLYNQAGDLLKEGKMIDARSNYRKIISECSGSSLISDANARLEDLNIQILFSPVPTEDSVLYVVEPGDALSKIAKKFNTTVELIMKSNALQGALIRPGDKLKISKAKYSILVDKSQNVLILKANGEVFKNYTVATGANNSTPIGTYQIKEKIVNPTWYKTGAVIPPDSPENILGTRWMAITLEHYGIHGTTDESALGRQVTAGCVRMSNKDVEELYSIVPVGTEVVIID